MLLDLILEVHAWSTSKPESESAAVGDALFQEAQNILQREQEQGMFSFFVGMPVLSAYNVPPNLNIELWS
jgi:hypothetical protein